MKNKLVKWLLSTALAGAVAVGAGSAVLRAQNPNDPPPGSRADQREDKQQARQLGGQIQGDQQRLRSDVHQFGRNSPQARADRQQLRQDRRAMSRLRQDQRYDRRVRN